MNINPATSLTHSFENEDLNTQVTQPTAIQKICEASNRIFDNFFPHGTDRRYFTLLGTKVFSVIALVVGGYFSQVGLGHLMFSSKRDDFFDHYFDHPMMAFLITVIVVGFSILFGFIIRGLCLCKQEWHQEEQKLLNQQRSYVPAANV